MGALVILGILLLSSALIESNRLPLKPEVESTTRSQQPVEDSTYEATRNVHNIRDGAYYDRESEDQNRDDTTQRNHDQQYRKPAYKTHLFDESPGYASKPYEGQFDDDKIDLLLETVQRPKWHVGEFEDEEKDFLGDLESFDDYKTSATTAIEGPGQIETSATSSFHKEVPSFDVSDFKHQHHGGSEKHGEVHYHQHKHVHKHDHKQDHKHHHKQEHKHEHGHKHEQHHKHEHGHKHDNHHKHDHHHGHKHDHHQDHKHDHHHGHKHDHHAEHKHHHDQHHKHDHGHKHDHDHKHHNSHKHDHHHGHKHSHHGNHKHDHGHKHDHSHKHGHKHEHKSHGKHF